MSLFQKCINLLVLLMATMFVWAYVSEQFLGDYEFDTLPDEVRSLDDEITDYLTTLPANFGEMYDERGTQDEYTFMHEENAVPLKDNENYKRTIPGIVYITTEDFDGWQYLGTGSILTEDGVIVTNYHIVAGAEKVVITTFDKTHYSVSEVLASDEVLDIVFLKIQATDLSPIPVGDSDALEVGDKTLVIGHPEGFINTLSIGNVAGFRGYESQGAGTNIQITNPISSGNSGGAVLNEYGELVGVPSWSFEYDDNSVQVQNLNFAVPINEALELLK